MEPLCDIQNDSRQKKKSSPTQVILLHPGIKYYEGSDLKQTEQSLMNTF